MGKVFNVSDDPKLFDQKKEVIFKLNQFVRRFAAHHQLTSKLDINEVKNNNGQFIELVGIVMDPSDNMSVWYKTYANIVIPTVNSLVFDSIFPADHIRKEMDALWKVWVESEEATESTALNMNGIFQTF